MKEALTYFTPFTKEETLKVSKFIDSIENKTTCLHGDFHIGNFVMTDKNEVLFIDMGDFAYGDPRFDLACLYFNMYNPLEEAGPTLFHCEVPVLKKFWRDFIKHYYNLKSEDEIDNATEEIKKYAGLIIIYYAKRVRVEPWMNDLVHKFLIDKI